MSGGERGRGGGGGGETGSGGVVVRGRVSGGAASAEGTGGVAGPSGAELPEGAALTADAGYFSEDNVRITGEHGLDPHIATGRFKHSEPALPAPRGPVAKNATPKQRMARKLRTKTGRATYARRKT